MSPIPEPQALEALDGKIVRLSLVIELPAREVGMAEPMWDQIMLGRAAVHLADDVPNKAVAILVGAALSAACRADCEQTFLAMGAVVAVVKDIAESQAEGVI